MIRQEKHILLTLLNLKNKKINLSNTKMCLTSIGAAAVLVNVLLEEHFWNLFAVLSFVGFADNSDILFPTVTVPTMLA